jgi:hypothetical protein
MRTGMTLVGTTIVVLGVVAILAHDGRAQQPGGPPLHVTFRDAQRGAVLAPGETLVTAAACEAGEVVVTGGYSANADPTATLRVTLNTFFFDGQSSGWRTDFYNHGSASVAVSVRVNYACARGRGFSE